MAEIFPPTTAPGNLLYSSNGSTTVGVNSTVRASMLPPPQTGTGTLVKAGQMPVGGYIRLEGFGVISAANVAPGSFMFYPNVTPAGGSKTDLGGLTATPLIGVVGICDLFLYFIQTPTGLLTGGRIHYGLDNSTTSYTLTINPNDLIVASDPTVDRTFGVDGQWQTANAANYVTPKMVTMTMGRL